MVSREDELGIGRERRRVDLNEEYYRLAAKVCACAFGGGEGKGANLVGVLGFG